MRKCKRFFAMLMALVIAVTSINLPAVSAYAQETDGGMEEEEVATLSDAGYTDSITEGQSKTVTITVEDEEQKFRFVPQTSGSYHIYATSDYEDTLGAVYDADGNEIYRNDDSDDNENTRDFGIYGYLEAGKEYTIGARYYSNGTGSFTIKVEKNPDIKSVNVTRYNDCFLENAYNLFINVDMEITASNEEKKTFTNNTSLNFSVWGHTMKIWIKDSKNSYSYVNSEGVRMRYTEASVLSAGAYTVEIREGQTDSNNYSPDGNSTLYASYKINVQTADVYFDGRQTVSETEDRTFTSGSSLYEYYRFIPSQTGGYYLDCFGKSSIPSRVYCLDGTEVYINNNHISVEKGNTYCIGLSGYTYDEDDNTTYDISFRAIAYREPVSASWTLPRNEFVQYVDSDDTIINDVNISVTYADGTSEKLERTDTYSGEYQDSYRNIYMMFYAGEDEDWDAHTLYSESFIPNGSYTVSLGWYKGAGEYDKLSSKSVTVKSLEDINAVELKAGKNQIHSSEGLYDNNVYKITMPYNAKMDFSISGNYNIYRKADNEWEFFSNSYNDDIYDVTYTKGETYYFVFSNKAYVDGGYVDNWETELSIVPEIEKLEVAQQPYSNEVVYGDSAYMRNSYFDGAKIKVTYSNGETCVCDGGSSISPAIGGNISAMIHDDDNDEEWSVYDIVSCGSYDIVFTSDSGKTCQYPVVVKKISDMNIPSLKEGDNQVQTSGQGADYYRFTPSVTGIYNIRVDSNAYIYKEDSEGKVVRVYSAGYSDYCVKVYMNKDVTYYLDVSCGAQNDWGDKVTEWNMTVDLPESQRVVAPVSWSATGNILSKQLVYCSQVDRDNLERDCEDFSVKIKYADESTCVVNPIFPDYDDGTDTDKFQNNVKHEVQKKDESDGTYKKCVYYDEDFDEEIELSTYTVGTYRIQVKLYNNDGEEYTDIPAIYIPFTVCDPTTAPDGDWDITSPLHVDNNKMTYIYRLVIPQGINAVSIEANTDTTSLRMYDSDGKNISVISSVISDGNSSYDRYQFDVPSSGDVYMAVKAGSSDSCKLTAVTNKAVTAVETTVDRTEYWKNIDYIDLDSVKCKVTYADGSQDVYTGSDSSISWYLESGDDRYWLNRYLDETGDYYIKADIVGKTADCKETYAKITVKDYDYNSLPVLNSGVETTVENTGDKDIIKLYKLNVSEKMLYSCSYTGESNDVSVPLEGGEYIAPDSQNVVMVLVRAKHTEVLTLNLYPYMVKENIRSNETKKFDQKGSKQKYEYTFVPESDGMYIIESSSIAAGDSIGDPKVTLYQDNNLLDEDDDDGDGSHFKLAYKLKKGVTYKYVAYNSSRGVYTYNIKLSKLDGKQINNIEFQKSSFYIVKRDADYCISGDYIIKYSDNTESMIYFDTGYGDLLYIDKYGNEVQVKYSIVTEGEKEYAVISARYRQPLQDDWTKATDEFKAEVTIKEAENWDTVIEEDKQYTSDESKIILYKFCPKTTAKYVVIVNDYSYVNIKNLDTGNYIDKKNGGYELVAGREYGIYFNASLEDSDQASFMIRKASIISDIDVLYYTGSLYGLLNGNVDYSNVTVRVSYIDGTANDCELDKLDNSNNNISCSVAEEDADGATINVSLNGITAHKRFKYSDYYEVRNMTLSAGVVTSFVPKTDTAYSTDPATVYKIVIPQNGEYCIGYNTDINQIVYGAKAGAKWSVIEDNSKLTCKKGDVYYITVETYDTVSPVYIGLMTSMDWKVVNKPTCTKAGLKVKLNTSTGEYEEVSIPATGHKFTKYTYNNNATCTRAGTKTAICDNGCNTKKTVKDSAHPALGHRYGAWTLSQAAEYGKDGSRVKNCTKCGAQSADKQVISQIASVKLKIGSYVFDNKAKKPGIIVKDGKNNTIGSQNYTVKYANNTAVGTATATVTFKGVYKGQIKRTFVIKPAAVDVVSVKPVSGGLKVSWKRSSAGASYIIYRKSRNDSYTKIITNTKTTSFVDKGLTNGGKYTYKIVAYKKIGRTTYKSAAGAAKSMMYVATPKVASVKNVASKKMVVRWTKNSKATGYQLQYATSKTFKRAKTIRFTNPKTVKKTLRSLAKKKRYYVRVRAYKKSGRVTYYSAWSTSKNVVIKK